MNVGTRRYASAAVMYSATVASVCSLIDRFVKYLAAPMLKPAPMPVPLPFCPSVCGPMVGPKSPVSEELNAVKSNGTV